MTPRSSDSLSALPISVNAGVAGTPSRTFAQRAGVAKCVAARRDCAPESANVRPADRQSNAQRRTNAAWLRAQLEELIGWLDSNPHRWPTVRVVAAQRAILAGDEHWRLRAAEVLR